jgi:hypothetical protein
MKQTDDRLYLPEILSAFMLITAVSAGSGPYSLDRLDLGPRRQTRRVSFQWWRNSISELESSMKQVQVEQKGYQMAP